MWDKLKLPMSLSWREYLEVNSSKKGLTDFLRRIHESFKVMKSDLKGSYSTQAEQELRRIEWEEDADEDEDEY